MEGVVVLIPQSFNSHCVGSDKLSRTSRFAAAMMN